MKETKLLCPSAAFEPVVVATVRLDMDTVHFPCPLLLLSPCLVTLLQP